MTRWHFETSVYSMPYRRSIQRCKLGLFILWFYRAAIGMSISSVGHYSSTTYCTTNTVISLRRSKPLAKRPVVVAACSSSSGSSASPPPCQKRKHELMLRAYDVATGQKTTLVVGNRHARVRFLHSLYWQLVLCTCRTPISLYGWAVAQWDSGLRDSWASHLARAFPRFGRATCTWPCATRAIAHYLQHSVRVVIIRYSGGSSSGSSNNSSSSSKTSLCCTPSHEASK
jgi:hypothetical protein